MSNTYVIRTLCGAYAHRCCAYAGNAKTKKRMYYQIKVTYRDGSTYTETSTNEDDAIRKCERYEYDDNVYSATWCAISSRKYDNINSQNVW